MRSKKRVIMIQDDDLEVLATFEATPTQAVKILKAYRISGHPGAFGIDLLENKTFNAAVTTKDLIRSREIRELQVDRSS
jgi:hypothetical protein